MPTDSALFKIPNERFLLMIGHERAISREIQIPSDLNAAHNLQSEIEGALQANGFTEAELFAVRMALEEALVNAIKHGNQMDPTKSVQISFTINPQRFEVRITDEGAGFDPDDVPDPTAPENLERPCGRGLLLMRYYMNEVSFHNRGNTISMHKVRKQ